MKRHEPFFSLALFLFCFLLYANNLKNEFVNYDDWWVVHNEKMLSWHTTSGFKKLFLGLSKETRFEHGAEFLPVRDLSASLQYRFFGESPTPYHVVQNILFSTSAVFFFQFLLSLGTSSAAAFLAALVFAAHPIHVESVTWLSGHKDVLSLFFALLSLWIYAKGRASLAFGIFLLALGSKYLILFLPVLLPPIDRVRGRPMSIRRYLLFFGASGATLGLSIYVASIVGYTPLPLGRSISGILRNVLALFDGGTSHLIAPLHLQLYYPYEPAVSWLDVRVWRGLAEVIALLAAFTYGWKNRSIVLIASTLWIAGFLPSLRTTEIHLLADRYLLFPSIGFAILCGAGLIHLSRWKGLGVMAPLIAVLLAAATIRQNRVWASSISLWEHAAYGDRPVQRETWENLANVYRDAGNWAEAAATYEQVIRQAKPGEKKFSEHGFNLGFCQLRLGRSAAAEDAFRKVVAVDPTSAKGHMNLGIALARQSKYRDARKSLEKARELDPVNVEIVFNLARLAVDQQRWRDVRAYIKELDLLAPKDARLAQLRAVQFNARDESLR